MPAYKPNPNGPVRDRTYPSEIAAQRPALAPRILCEEDYHERRENDEASIRGDHGTLNEETYEREITEDRVAQFNRALRAGHGWRNAGDE